MVALHARPSCSQTDKAMIDRSNGKKPEEELYLNFSSAFPELDAAASPTTTGSEQPSLTNDLSDSSSEQRGQVSLISLSSHVRITLLINLENNLERELEPWLTDELHLQKSQSISDTPER